MWSKRRKKGGEGGGTEIISKEFPGTVIATQKYTLSKESAQTEIDE